MNEFSIDFFYPEHSPDVAVVRYQNQQYLVGLKQNMHQEVMRQSLSPDRIDYVMLSHDNGVITNHNLLTSLARKIDGIELGGYLNISLTNIYTGSGAESGHTTHLLIIKDSAGNSYITLINQSTERQSNQVYLPTFHQIRTMLPQATLIGANGTLNGLYPFGSIYFMCLESAVLFDNLHQRLGSDMLILILQEYAQRYEALEELQPGTALTYQQLCDITDDMPFNFNINDFVRLRFELGMTYRQAFAIEERLINGQPMSMTNIVDHQIITADMVMRYFSGRQIAIADNHALEQNILESLPFVTHTELGHPQDLCALLREHLGHVAAVDTFGWSDDQTWVLQSDDQPFNLMPTDNERDLADNQSFNLDDLNQILWDYEIFSEEGAELNDGPINLTPHEPADFLNPPHEADWLQSDSAILFDLSHHLDSNINERIVRDAKNIVYRYFNTEPLKAYERLTALFFEHDINFHHAAYIYLTQHGVMCAKKIQAIKNGICNLHQEEMISIIDNLCHAISHADRQQPLDFSKKRKRD